MVNICHSCIILFSDVPSTDITWYELQDTTNRKSQSNLARGRKLPIGYNGHPTFAPKITPSSGQIPQTQLPASSMGPSDLPSQTAPISDQLFCYNAPDTQTD